MEGEVGVQAAQPGVEAGGGAAGGQRPAATVGEAQARPLQPRAQAPRLAAVLADHRHPAGAGEQGLAHRQVGDLRLVLGFGGFHQGEVAGSGCVQRQRAFAGQAFAGIGGVEQ